MRRMFATLFALVATSALAGDDSLAVVYSKELVASLAVSVCEAKTQPASIVGAYGVVTHSYGASVEDLHRCQYVSEMHASGCIQGGSCQDYERWKLTNPEISPDLPRAAFLSALEERKAARYR